MQNNYYNLNTTGMQKYVRHGLPWSSPGFHFGIMRITRNASRSSSGLTDLTTFGLLYRSVFIYYERHKDLALYLLLLCNDRI